MESANSEICYFVSQFPAFVRHAVAAIAACGLFLLATHAGEKLGRGYFHFMN
jgi:hypothetical protein